MRRYDMDFTGGFHAMTAFVRDVGLVCATQEQEQQQQQEKDEDKGHQAPVESG